MSGEYTPLQLQLIGNFLNNTGLKIANTDLNNELNNYLGFGFLASLNSTISLALDGNWLTESTLSSLRNIRASSGTEASFLGNSVSTAVLAAIVDPEDFYGTSPGYANYVRNMMLNFNGRAANTAVADYSIFAQVFTQVNAFIKTSNQVITSTVNANTYLGPTFPGVNSLTTANIAAVNPVFDRFGFDVARQGQLVNTAKLELYGTPAGLINQISNVSGIVDGTTTGLTSKLLNQGLSENNIADLANDNRYSLTNPNGLSSYEFDRLQKLAYRAFGSVSGTDLQEILDILDVTTPGINTLADLLDPVKVYPLSYSTLIVPGTDGNNFIYMPDGTVNSTIAAAVNAYLPSLSGCDELGKIIPQSTATANKALQVSLQNVPGIVNSSWPEFAQAIATNIDNPWSAAQEYLPNEIVSVQTAPMALPSYYQSQQSVPVGINVTDTTYWAPVSLGNLQTMQDLNGIQAQTTPLSSFAESVIESELATGTGEYNTITFKDIMGIGSCEPSTAATNVATVNNVITAIAAAGWLNGLTEIFSVMQLVANGSYGDPYVGPVDINDSVPGQGVYNNSFPYTAGDLALQALITLAITEIGLIRTQYPVQTAAAQAAWDALATEIAVVQGYLTRADIDLTDPAVGQTSIISFVQSIDQFAEDKGNYGAYWYLNCVAETTTLGGQTLVAALRESSNLSRLDQANILARPQDRAPVASTPGNDFVDPPIDGSLVDESFPETRQEVTDAGLVSN